MEKNKREIKNLVENLRDKIIFRNANRENNFNDEKVGFGNSVYWNYTNLILNWSQKDSDSYHLDPNCTDSNQPIPANSINIRSIHYAADIRAIKKIVALSVHSLLHVSPIFHYRIASDPLSPSHDSPSESMTPKGNSKPRKNPPNTLPDVPYYLDSDPSLPYSSLLESSDLSDENYHNQR